MELIVGGGIAVALLIGAAVVAGLVALFVVVPKIVTGKMAPALERRIATEYSSDQVILKDLKAATHGLESRGVLQGRGNGALVLTATELGWFRFVQGGDVRIPRESITKVDTVKWHLGKSYGRDLLRVTFTNDGKPDTIAWYVTDLGAWLSKLGEPTSATR